MALFDSYLSECHEALLGASSRLREAEAASPRSRRPLLSLASSSLETAKHTLPLLELEARALPPHAKQEVRAVRSELSELKGRVKMLRNGADTSDCLREELFASHASGESSECASMLGAHERIASGTDRLKEVNAATLDMESTANSILGDLASQASALQAGVEVSSFAAEPSSPGLLQRETLLRARSTLRFASDGLENSDRILRSMARRAASNKAVRSMQSRPSLPHPLPSREAALDSFAGPVGRDRADRDSHHQSATLRISLRGA
ncbi:MAG: hypothetical protein SGPRY_007812 [Prymnesium sp.]